MISKFSITYSRVGTTICLCVCALCRQRVTGFSDYKMRHRIKKSSALKCSCKDTKIHNVYKINLKALFYAFLNK